MSDFFVADVDVLKNDKTLFIEGESFLLEVSNSAVNELSYLVHIEDGFLSIDGNETTIQKVSPWNVNGDTVNLFSGVKARISSVGDGFLVGRYENIPIYSPFYGVSSSGNVYKISHPRRIFEDDFVGSCTDSEYLVTNVESGLCDGKEKEAVHEKFENGEWNAAIKIN